MSAPTFTPGDWRRDGNLIEAVQADGTVLDVAEVFDDGSCPEQAKADADLLAASKALYAALTAYRSVFAMMPDRLRDELSKWKGFRDAQGDAVAALEQAEGRR